MRIMVDAGPVELLNGGARWDAPRWLDIPLPHSLCRTLNMSASPPSYASLSLGTMVELLAFVEQPVEPQTPTWFSIKCVRSGRRPPGPD